MIDAQRVAAIVAEMRMPALSIYGGDWMRDPVASCSLGAQGLWFRMMLSMHDARPYGHLVGANGQPLAEIQIARQCGCTNKGELRKLLGEIEAVGVPGRTGDASYAGLFVGEINHEAIDLSPLRIESVGVIYSRRMVRDQRLRVVRRLAAATPKANGSNLVGQNAERSAGVRVRRSSSFSSSSSNPEREENSSTETRRSRNGNGHFKPLWTKGQFQYKADKIAEYEKRLRQDDLTDEEFAGSFKIEWGMDYAYWIAQRDAHMAHFLEVEG